MEEKNLKILKAQFIKLSLKPPYFLKFFHILLIFIQKYYIISVLFIDIGGNYGRSTNWKSLSPF